MAGMLGGLAGQYNDSNSSLAQQMYEQQMRYLQQSGHYGGGSLQNALVPVERDNLVLLLLPSS